MYIRTMFSHGAKQARVAYTKNSHCHDELNIYSESFSFSGDEISMVTGNGLQPYPSADDSGEQTITVEGSPEPETSDIEKCSFSFILHQLTAQIPDSRV